MYAYLIYKLTTTPLTRVDRQSHCVAEFGMQHVLRGMPRMGNPKNKKKIKKQKTKDFRGILGMGNQKKQENKKNNQTKDFRGILGMGNQKNKKKQKQQRFQRNTWDGGWPEGWQSFVFFVFIFLFFFWFPIARIPLKSLVLLYFFLCFFW